MGPIRLADQAASRCGSRAAAAVGKASASYRSRARQPLVKKRVTALQRFAGHGMTISSRASGSNRGFRNGEVDVRRKNSAASYIKLFLQFGTVAIITWAMFESEANAQTRGEALSKVGPHLDEASIEPLRPGMTDSQVLAALATHNQERKAALHDYTVLRTYQVVDLKGKVHAEEIGRMEFFTPDKKTFTVTSESGSGLIRRMAIARLVVNGTGDGTEPTSSH
jgi:hypothetical protein